MALNVVVGLQFILLALGFGGFLAVFVTRSGLWTAFTLVLDREGFGWGTVAGICVVGIGGLAVAAAAGRSPFGEGATGATTVGTILFLTGSVLAGRAIGRYPRYRRLSAADETAVRDCDAGDMVALNGTVDSNGDMMSPHTQTPCVAYDARIETGIRTLRFPSRFWLVDDRRMDSHPFSLTDETGTLTVDPTDAQVRLPVSPVSSAETATVLFRRFLGGTTVDPDGPSSRYAEGTLEAGDPIRVVGRVVDGRSVENDRSRTALVADVVSVGPTGERTHRTAVRRHGPLGVGLVVVGFTLMIGLSLGL